MGIDSAIFFQDLLLNCELTYRLRLAPGLTLACIDAERIPDCRMWIRPENTLLLVEPDSFVRRCLAGALEKAGYRVLQASDSQEALRLVRQNAKIRLVISEVLLPSSPASAFVKDLRRLRRDLPLLFTSSVHPSLLNQSLPRRDILHKPFSPDRLVERVGRQLKAPQVAARLHLKPPRMTSYEPGSPQPK